MSNLGNKEVLSRNLRRLMDEKQVDRQQICKDLEFKYTTFTDWYNGKKYPRIDKIEQMANYFGIRKSDLIEEPKQEESLPAGAFAYDISKLHRIPVLGQIAAGLPLYAEENIEGYTYTDLNGGAEYFALRVKGDSMNALRINEGDIVIVRRQSDVENGEVAVVLIDGDSATLKRFYRTDSAITLMPQSTNAEHQPQVYDPAKTRIDVLGKVVKVEFML